MLQNVVINTIDFHFKMLLLWGGGGPVSVVGQSILK